MPPLLAVLVLTPVVYLQTTALHESSHWAVAEISGSRAEISMLPRKTPTGFRFAETRIYGSVTPAMALAPRFTDLAVILGSAVAQRHTEGFLRDYFRASEIGATTDFVYGCSGFFSDNPYNDAHQGMRGNEDSWRIAAGLAITSVAIGVAIDLLETKQ